MDASDEPMFANTGDDARFYSWPHLPGCNLPSITTIIKKGIPNEILEQWKLGKTATLATERAEILMQLREVENGIDVR